MTFRISSIADAAEANRQRIVIRIGEDGDIGEYVVLLASALDDGKAASGAAKAAYWFQDRAVSKGDIVILYTKSGKNSEKLNENGHKSHFFYWGIGLTSFTEWTPVLLHAPKYQIFALPT
jgi:hypothetical protein